MFGYFVLLFHNSSQKDIERLLRDREVAQKLPKEVIEELISVNQDYEPRNIKEYERMYLSC